MRLLLFFCVFEITQFYFNSRSTNVLAKHLGQLTPPGTPWPANPKESTINGTLENSSIYSILIASDETISTKSPLEYKPQRPTFAGRPGGISSGNLGQLIPPGKPWPANPPESTVNTTLENSSTYSIHISSDETTTTKSPLEYKPQRPTYAGRPGGISSGNLGQLIPPGKPWPANPPESTVTTTLENSSTYSIHISSDETTTTKSPLEYKPQRPTYAGRPGGISSGNLGQLIPPGKPWPANPPESTINGTLENSSIYFILIASDETTSTKSPLEYKPQRPTFAGRPGGISSGNLGQLIPPGKPWPANPPESTVNTTLENSSTYSIHISSDEKATTKSPLEYKPQRPTYAGRPGGISSGNLGQLIPPGKPWPANPPESTVNTTLENSSTYSIHISSDETTTTKSPLEYKPQRPTYAGRPGGISSGNLGQLIPPGKPWPANPPESTVNTTLENSSTYSIHISSDETTTTKSPLVYKPQRPTYAGRPGGISSGNLGQLIPPGKPWPANPPESTVTTTLENSSTYSIHISSDETTTTKSPLEYKPQRPTYAGRPGGISSGNLGQLIPPGKPWPANPPESTINGTLENSSIYSILIASDETTSTKSPLEYKPQRPTFAGRPGGISSGNLGQLIPPGKPWPANPPESTVNTTLENSSTYSIHISSDEKATTKSPLEYKPQRPTYAGRPGGISSGNLGQLIPPGKPWPANPPESTINGTLGNSSIYSILIASDETTSTKSSLEYKPQKPTFAGRPGGISSGNLGQLIPPGKPWPANPPESTVNTTLENSSSYSILIASDETTSTKSPFEYKPQRPTFAGRPGGISSGNLGQLIPPGKPWPANPPESTVNTTLENSSSYSIHISSDETTTTKSPLEYKPQRPTYAGRPGGISSGNLGQLIPPGKPWPANPPESTVNTTLENSSSFSIHISSDETITTKSPLEYKPQRPTYAGRPGGISSGNLGQLIPPGKPWPANPPETTVNTTMENSSIYSILIASDEATTAKSPMEYKPQRPTYAGRPGGISSENLGQLIPPGKPWLANPPEIMALVY